MKNKFWVGFLSGLAGAVLLIALGFGASSLLPKNSGIFGSGGKLSPSKDRESTDLDEVVEKLKGMDKLIDQHYLEEVDEESLVDGIYKGFVSGLGDPYSYYYTEEEYALLRESSSGVYYGIGATVSQDVTTGIISIVKPFLTGPAYESGLLPKDIIYKVNGQEVTGDDLTEVVSKIKGPEGTSVDIVIIREGESEELEFAVPRRKIEVPTIEYAILEDQIGYISIAEFDEVTVGQFKDALDSLDKQGQKGLIVDVRNNPGGLLDSVTQMLDRLLPEGLIVYTEDKHGNRQEIKSDAKESFNKPLVILINGSSASASEIFAGAIQDYEIGTIVGTKTFGKGIVQSIYPLDDNTAVKVTVSKYFTPKGRDIHKTGIYPDVEVDLDEELKKLVVIDKEEDNQLQKGIEVIKNLIDAQ